MRKEQETEDFFLRIIPSHLTKFSKEEEKEFSDPIVKILQNTIPNSFWQERQKEVKEKKESEIQRYLPIVTRSDLEGLKGPISFFVVAKKRQGAFKFFYEMMIRWLIPGKTLPLISLYTTDFCLPDMSTSTFTACKITLHIETKEEQEEIRKNFPILQIEVALGMQSSFYARRILEIKGLIPEDKTALIHAHMAKIVERLPSYFSLDIFSEMQHFLIACQDSFKEQRTSHHLSRLITIHYLFQKELLKEMVFLSQKRQIRRKIFRAKIQEEGRFFSVVGVSIGLNFLKEREIFEEQHLLKAIKQIVPDAELVKNSFLFQKRPQEKYCTLYLEIHSPKGISDEEINHLRKFLAHEIEMRIEHLHQPIFMPRNEEEIMRNLLSLSEQIRFVRDIPQVYIFFDEQTDSSVFFTIILVRLLKKESTSIQKLFKRKNSPLEYIHDRTRLMGTLRKKYPKEATVFRLRLGKELFLREDQSIDLYRARSHVILELTRILGPVRDFNGGMIFKETKTFSAFSHLFKEDLKIDRVLLENFFHSLTPAVMRTMIDPHELKTLFLFLLETNERNRIFEKIVLFGKVEKNSLYFLIQTDTFSIKENFEQLLKKLQFLTTDAAFTEIKISENSFIGMIVKCDRQESQKFLIQEMEMEIEKCNLRKKIEEREKVTASLGQRFLLKINTKNKFTE